MFFKILIYELLKTIMHQLSKDIPQAFVFIKL